MAGGGWILGRILGQYSADSSEKGGNWKGNWLRPPLPPTARGGGRPFYTSFPLFPSLFSRRKWKGKPPSYPLAIHFHILPRPPARWPAGPPATKTRDDVTRIQAKYRIFRRFVVGISLISPRFPPPHTHTPITTTTPPRIDHHPCLNLQI